MLIVNYLLLRGIYVSVTCSVQGLMPILGCSQLLSAAREHD